MRRSLLIAGGAAVVVVAGGGVGAWLLLSGGSQGSATSVAAALPTGAALNALSTLSAPSVAQPLPGSEPGAGANTYLYKGSCSTAEGQYRSNRSLLPSGAKLSDAGGGTLIVTSDAGTSAILFASAAQSTCNYTIAVQPTVIISGNGPVPSAQTFAQVGCLSPYTQPSLGMESAALQVNGQPYVIVIGSFNGNFGGSPPPSSAYKMIFAPGTPAQLQSALSQSSPPGTVYPVTVQDTNDGRIVATIAGAAETVSLECTAPFSSIISLTPAG